MAALQVRGGQIITCFVICLSVYLGKVGDTKNYTAFSFIFYHVSINTHCLEGCERLYFVTTHTEGYVYVKGQYHSALTKPVSVLLSGSEGIGYS